MTALGWAGFLTYWAEILAIGFPLDATTEIAMGSLVAYSNMLGIGFNFARGLVRG